MVFELGFDEEEFRRYRRVLFVALRRYPVKQIRREFPALLATYMAYAGTFLYEGGDYWSSLHPTLKDADAEAGRHFIGAVRSLGLETFDRIVAEERAHPWVSRILAQGGIPRSCLSPFVGLVAREVAAGAADGAELLAGWRRRGASLTQLHVPTRRFLLYGGAEATDLVDRCVELLRDVAELGRMPSPTEAGLPAYVVEAFADLDDASPQRSRAGAVRDGLPRPELRLEPYDALGPVVIVPAVAADRLGGTWRVETGDRVHRQEPSTYTAETVKVAPAASVGVEFLTTEGVRRQWTFELLGSRPILFFDPHTQRLIRAAGSLAADEVWMLAPAGAEVTTGDGQPLKEIQELPRPVGAWEGFTLRHVDLQGVESLRFDDGHGQVRSTLVTRPRARPELEGRALPGVVADGDAQVYASAPLLRVPVGSESVPWTIQVRGVDWQRTELVDPDREGRITVRPFLPESGFGVFRLRARGPIGSDLSVRFGLVEDLRVAAPVDLVLPSSQPPEVTLQAPDVRVGDSEIPGKPQTVTLQSESATVARARLHHDSGPALDLGVAIPRLLWTIVHDTKPALRAAARVVNVDAEEFDDHLTDTLVLSTGREGVPLGLELRSRDGRVLQRLPHAITVGHSGRWAFDLGPFAGTIQHAEGARMAIHLKIGLREVHLANIVSGAHVRALRASVEDDAVRISFDETRPVRDRVVRLWSGLRPWQPPVTVPVPDGDVTVTAPLNDALPPGPYLAEVSVEDPWVLPARPSAFSPGVRPMGIGEREAVVSWLEALDPSDPRTLVTWALGGYRGETRFDIERLADAALEAALALRVLLDDTGTGQPSSNRFAALASVLSARDTVLAATLARARELEGHEDWLYRLDLRLAEHMDPTSDPLDAQVVAALWAACPGVAVLLDLPWVGMDDEARDRCRLHLGWLPEDGPVDPGGAKVSQLELKAPAEQLRDIRFTLGLQPTGLLDPAVRVLATFDWLLAQHDAERRVNDDGPRGWYYRHRGLLVLDDLSMPAEAADEIRRHVDARLRARGTEEWASVPAVLIAAAASYRWGNDARRYPALLALEEALPWARRMIRSDHALLNTLATVGEMT